MYKYLSTLTRGNRNSKILNSLISSHHGLINSCENSANIKIDSRAWMLNPQANCKTLI